MSNNKVTEPSVIQYAEVTMYNDDNIEEQEAATSAAVMQSHPLKRPKTIKEMVIDAIIQLNENKGSSLVAIHKYIKANYDLPNGELRKERVSRFLKDAKSSGQLEMVKLSYRLSNNFKKTAKAEEKLKAKNKLKAKEIKAKEKLENLKRLEKEKHKQAEKIKAAVVKRRQSLPARLGELLETTDDDNDDDVGHIDEQPMKPSTSRYSLAATASSSSLSSVAKNVAATSTRKRAMSVQNNNNNNNNNNDIDTVDKTVKSGTPTDPTKARRKSLNVQKATKLKASSGAAKRRVVDMNENEEIDDAVEMMPKTKKKVNQAAGKPTTGQSKNRKNIIF